MLIYADYWSRGNYTEKYETYKESYKPGAVLKYPPYWLYKGLWIVSYLCLWLGSTVGWIYIDEKTVWYISTLSLFFVIILVMHFWHIAFWKWNNWNGVGTLCVIFLALASGGNAGIFVFREIREGTPILWGAFAGYLVFFIMTSYVSLVMVTSKWRKQDEKKGYVVKKKKSKIESPVSTTKRRKSKKRRDEDDDY